MKDGERERPIENYGKKEQKERLDNIVPDPRPCTAGNKEEEHTLAPVQQGTRRKSTYYLNSLRFCLRGMTVQPSYFESPDITVIQFLEDELMGNLVKGLGEVQEDGICQSGPRKVISS